MGTDGRSGSFTTILGVWQRQQSRLPARAATSCRSTVQRLPAGSPSQWPSSSPWSRCGDGRSGLATAPSPPSLSRCPGRSAWSAAHRTPRLAVLQSPSTIHNRSRSSESSSPAQPPPAPPSGAHSELTSRPVLAQASDRHLQGDRDLHEQRPDRVSTVPEDHRPKRPPCPRPAHRSSPLIAAAPRG
jgi:hypothetical protein